MEVLRWLVVHMRDDTPCRRGLPVDVWLYHLIVDPILSGGLKGSILGPHFGPALRIAKVV